MDLNADNGESQLPVIEMPGERGQAIDKTSRVLLALNEAIVSLPDVHKLLDRTCQIVAEMSGCDICGISLYRAESEQYELVAITGLPAETANNLKRLVIKRKRSTPYDKLIFGEAKFFEIKSKSSVENDFKEWSGALSGHDGSNKSILFFPISYQDEILGLVILTNSTGLNHLGENDLKVLETVIKMVGYAVANLVATPPAMEPDPKRNETVTHFSDELIFLVAHELRTPMGIIKGYSQLIKHQLEKFEGSEPQCRNLDMVIEQTTKMNRLIEDLLDLSQIEAGQFDLDFQPCNLLGITRQIIKVFQLNSPDVIFVLGPKSGPDTGQYTGLFDTGRLDQVITNLISNAVKYSPDGGFITLTLQNQTFQDCGFLEYNNSSPVNYPVNVNFDPTDRVIHFTISDKGIGIPLEQQGKVFDYLFRSTNSSARKISGLGLGLFISRQIINGHGGLIWVESQGENLGTTVQFILPIK